MSRLRKGEAAELRAGILDLLDIADKVLAAGASAAVIWPCPTCGAEPMDPCDVGKLHVSRFARCFWARRHHEALAADPDLLLFTTRKGYERQWERLVSSPLHRQMRGLGIAYHALDEARDAAKGGQ